MRCRGRTIHIYSDGWSVESRREIHCVCAGSGGVAARAGTAEGDLCADPNETQIKYDLYRIPFNGGKGGVAETIVGASEMG